MPVILRYNAWIDSAVQETQWAADWAASWLVARGASRDRPRGSRDLRGELVGLRDVELCFWFGCGTPKFSRGG